MNIPTEAQVHEIDIETVRHIAHLARLAITDDEAALFSKQMTTIIEYFNQLGEVDVADVPPANLLQRRTDHLRDDEEQPSVDREEFLSGAPARQKEFVKIAPVFGE